MIVAGDMTVGAMVAASILSARALAPMRQMLAPGASSEQAREAVGRLEELLRRARARPAAGLAGAEIRLQGRLEVEAVTFRYPGAKRPALDDGRFTVAPGTMLGIAGAPGSGKSTLVRLSCWAGDAGGRPRAARRARPGPAVAGRLRGQIGVVPQEVQLFSGSVAENIGMGAADRRWRGSSPRPASAGADEFIRRLPEGYDTVLGERGAGLSLGQRQLIAVARAIVRNPRMLVLDEATSALDPAAEAHLLSNIRRAGSGRTVVLVTHRPAVLAACDRVILLEHGRIVAAGPPAEVLRATRPAAARGSLQAVA